MKQLSAMLFLGCLSLISVSMYGLTINHKNTDINALNQKNIRKAKKMFKVWYGHTSHGSQITSGMQAMNRQPFKFSRNGGEDVLSYQEVGGDLGHRGNLRWAARTRQQLNKTGNDRNLVMWSWCGGCSDNTPEGVMAYLKEMDKLEKEYPNVIFVYMTGHLDGSGKNGNLNKINTIIRDFCEKHNKVLFDFADIESFAPSGTVNYMELLARDTCDYRDNGKRRNWAAEWIAENPDHKFDLPGRAAHTHPLNGALKGRAFWVLLTELAAKGRGNVAFMNNDYQPPEIDAGQKHLKRDAVKKNTPSPIVAKKKDLKPFKKSYTFQSQKDFKDWKAVGGRGVLKPETGDGIISPKGTPALALLEYPLSLSKLTFKGKVEKGDHINWYANFTWDSSWHPRQGLGGIIRGDGAMLTINGKVIKVPNSPKIDKKEHTYEVSIANGSLIWKQDGKVIIKKQLPENIHDGFGQLGIGAYNSKVRISDIKLEGKR
jgi:hypothetical protein